MSAAGSRDIDEQAPPPAETPARYISAYEAMRLGAKKIRRYGGTGTKDPEQEIIDDNCAGMLDNN